MSATTTTTNSKNDNDDQKCRTVAILIFDDVEVLDFTGPYEVFNVTGELQCSPDNPPPFRVYTVAETNAPIRTRGNLVVHPNFSIYNLPQPVDILLIPGGSGTRTILKTKPHLIRWISSMYNQVEILASICTGSLLLAQAGLLQGLDVVTTHNSCIEELQSLLHTQNNNTTKVVRNKRYIDHGNILTAGGISAGIDMSLYVVNKLLGHQVLAATMKEMEYAWTSDTSSREW